MCCEEDVDAWNRFSDLPLDNEWLNMKAVKNKVPISRDSASVSLSDIFREQSSVPDPPSHIDVCIFHAPCFDGTAAAYAVGRRYSDCWFYGVNRGSGDTDMYLPKGLEGKNILLVDYVYSSDLMNQLIELASDVYVVDHHDSELEMLSRLPINLVFSTQYSASYLTWLWLFEEPPPILFAYINDNDTGNWSLTNVGKFIAGSSIYSPVLRPGWSECCDFEYFDECVSGGTDYVQSRILIGMIAKEIEWRDIRTDAQRCVDKRLVVAPEFKCRVLNISYSSNNGAVSKSLIEGTFWGEEYTDQIGPADLSFLYYKIDKNGSWKIALRSVSDSVNVGQIASYLGGGGHVNAASIIYYGDRIDDLFCSDGDYQYMRS
jgi:oligoribonuclease NrnB/cAMP/cGMP phosphodiesterase (DHH superfamily)